MSRLVRALDLLYWQQPARLFRTTERVWVQNPIKKARIEDKLRREMESPQYV